MKTPFSSRKGIYIKLLALLLLPWINDLLIQETENQGRYFQGGMWVLAKEWRKMLCLPNSFILLFISVHKHEQFAW